MADLVHLETQQQTQRQRERKTPATEIIAGAGFTLVGAPGFEPGTSCSQSRRDTGLRYAPCTGNLLYPAFRAQRGKERAKRATAVAGTRRFFDR